MTDEDETGDAILAAVPGIYVAVDEGRLEDALVMAHEVAPADPARAVVSAAMWGMHLRNSPDWSPQQAAVHAAATWSGLQLNAEGLNNGAIAEEILSAFEGFDGQEFTPEAAEILSRFDQRPGSAAIMEYLIRVMTLLVDNMKLQMLPPLVEHRSPQACEKFAVALVRAVLRQEPQPNVFSTEWNDR